MKKLLLAFALLTITAFVANAQTEKSTWLLGGSVSFQTSSGSSIFSLNPDLGVFIADNFAVGGNINLLTYSGNTSYSIGPFARYYFGTSEKGKFFGQGAVLFGGSSGSGYSSNNVGFGLALGYALFLNKSVALEFRSEYTKVGNGNNGIFGIGAGFQIHYKRFYK